MIELNVLSGIEDAAIYVGMCDNIDVRINEVFESVAGIEIENSRHCLVEYNYVHDNAGGLLAFALSFDEIIVTTFTAGAGQNTLPIWIFQNLFRPNQAPIVNVVAAALILVSIAPIYLSQRLTQEKVS